MMQKGLTYTSKDSFCNGFSLHTLRCTRHNPYIHKHLALHTKYSQMNAQIFLRWIFREFWTSKTANIRQEQLYVAIEKRIGFRVYLFLPWGINGCKHLKKITSNEKKEFKIRQPNACPYRFYFLLLQKIGSIPAIWAKLHCARLQPISTESEQAEKNGCHDDSK